MKNGNISIEEVMAITHKGRDFIIQAIQNGSFPGSYTVSKSGKRNVHIPRKAFYNYMNTYYRSPSDELINALVEKLTTK